MSEGSFESELSSTERRLHHYALASSRSSDVYDESMSSDDDKFERHSESERSSFDSFTRSMHLEFSRQSADDSPIIGKRPSSNMRSPNKVGCRKHTVTQLREVPTAFWPSWVYRMYDSYLLARKVAGKVALFHLFCVLCIEILLHLDFI